mmetsp:Transcript_1220/g.1597  ORF Transcript_1220/g.1597 Transcript_1220/m.1597 type:complete len:354 (+) Transcript_1220:101-1162(+)|eukprot:CAMPEP_0117744462 /NCGR_PEP_ID=MMETSP0947-20121206/6771_1 /TAXON_ID=44440 /ORGANISM="Chattonella subsalsa, Strain CCMP2191" /LENGTH=353 /DNA_ID=CAMNT_0005561411 /DNA_START=85 /DNA_END=1146 /DNA_ORIENTATION=+
MGGPNDGFAANGNVTLEQLHQTITTTEDNSKSKMTENGPNSTVQNKVLKNEDEKSSNTENTHSESESKSSWLSWFTLILLLLISYFTVPEDFRPTSPTLKHVWYYGWVTALSTGLGAIPLFFAKDIGHQMLGICNGIAAGMMLSASCSLMYEGATNEAGEDVALSETWRVAIGAVAGLLFIVLTKQILDKYEDLKLGDLQGVDAKKVLLIVFVMTLHSFSEGIGIGVSFGGSAGARLGVFISASLAVHNVPEGLAVALVLNPRKVSKLNTSLWCIFTSLPQPLMAVPAYLFVEQFIPLLPVGLGFAAGAMFWVAVFELFMEACEDSSKITATIIMISSFCAMFYVQHLIGEET